MPFKNYYINRLNPQSVKKPSQFYQNKDSVSFLAASKIPVYAKKTRSDEKILRFNSFREACVFLDANVSGSIPEKNTRFIKGYLVIRASEIEDKEGNINKIKMDEFLNKSRDCNTLPRIHTALYAKKLNDKSAPLKFNSIAEARKALGIRTSNIYSCIDGSARSAGGYIFIKADEVEFDGKIDDKAMEKFLQHEKISVAKIRKTIKTTGY